MGGEGGAVVTAGAGRGGAGKGRRAGGCQGGGALGASRDLEGNNQALSKGRRLVSVESFSRASLLVSPTPD